MAVTLTYAATCTVAETLSTSVDSIVSANRTLTHSAFNSTASLSGSTTPPVTKVAAFTKALGAGAGTIDLTSLTGVNGGSVDGTGLKVQVMKITAPTANANVISIIPAAANGYDFFGSDFKITLQPGAEALFYGNDATPDIAAADLGLTLAGTGAQELDFVIVMG